LRIILDISRLLGARQRVAPSGIDRVELAYAQHWIGRPPSTRSFVAELPWGGFALLPDALVEELVGTLSETWRDGVRKARANWLARRAGARLALGLGRRALAEVIRSPGPKAFLLVSHRALERPRAIIRMRQAGVAFVPLIHDLIPATHPEYARPGQPERHRRRLATTAMLADAVIANSAATAGELQGYVGEHNFLPRVLVAPLGVEPPEVESPPVPLRPYFIALGTIEPRKNHLLLLNLWREFAATMGQAAPRLLLVGRRGWENENILDMLERCIAIDGLVREAGTLPDREVAGLLRGARALLFPSFAEGYGLPLAESLALGTPAICSDLPALREVGRAAPDYLDPLDGAAWRTMILDYARPDSAARRAQLARLSAWQCPSWSDHFGQVDELLDELAGTTPAEPRQEPVAARSRPPLRMASSRQLAGQDEGVS
jgi:glycosyltransferase involved in cell wall biosynthesis